MGDLPVSRRLLPPGTLLLPAGTGGAGVGASSLIALVLLTATDAGPLRGSSSSTASSTNSSRLASTIVSFKTSNSLCAAQELSTVHGTGLLFSEGTRL